MIRIGSRGSDLALWQAHFLQAELLRIGKTSKIIVIKTQGDKIQHLSFDKMEGKGFFTKELEDALLAQEIDVAVHSHKDLPTEMHPDLCIAAVSYRANPEDMLLINNDAYDPKQMFGLKKGARLGTSSTRRKALIEWFRPDVQLLDLRGNVPTRIERLRSGAYDAILLAAAGLERLKIKPEGVLTIELPAKQWHPAPAQGVLAYQTLAGNASLIATLKEIHHADIEQSIYIERKTLNLLDGGCLLPLGVYCHAESNWIHASLKPLGADNFLRLALPYSEADPYKLSAQLSNRFRGKVLITASAKRSEMFCKTLTNWGLEVISEPIIEVSYRDLIWPMTPDWYFFSSAHAVAACLQHADAHQHLSKAKLAAVGPKTAQSLVDAGFQVDFAGAGEAPERVGEAFDQIAKGKIVFPIGNRSRRTVQLKLTQGQEAVDWMVYETGERSITLPENLDILAFTSPSNVEAFTALHGAPLSCPCFAIGETTASALREKGVPKVWVAYENTLEALAETIAGRLPEILGQG